VALEDMHHWTCVSIPQLNSLAAEYKCQYLAEKTSGEAADRKGWAAMHNRSLGEHIHYTKFSRTVTQRIKNTEK
jgi:hypothetical protein